ncbi:MAG: 23S rRNA (uridine(2552)-2'-O)-methyltransferase RlmE [Gammaproteobacteria bacterium]
MARSKSSKRWLKEHFSDQYVKQAQASGYRARAAYKLLEIQAKDQLIRPGMRVVDLGAAPGSWSQVAAELVGEQGHVFALDILPMDGLANTTIIQGDFHEVETIQQLLTAMQGQLADLVLSDMAPNMSGIKVVDQPRSMYLAELALHLARQILKPRGSLLVKVFQGEGFDNLLRDMRHAFNKVATRKPSASRDRSREIYLLARGYKNE